MGPGNVSYNANKAIQSEQVKDMLESAATLADAQETSQKNFLESTETNAVLPRKQKQPIKKRRSEKTVTQSSKAGDKGDQAAIPAKPVVQTAKEFEERNRELDSRVLTQLGRDIIKPGDTKEEIIAKVRLYYMDESLVDEVLDFLLDVTEGALRQEVQAAKEELSKEAEQQRRIVAGRNIGADARQAAEKAKGALGTPTDLRETYRTITRDPHKEAPELFNDLSSKYAFKELKSLVDFLLHALGSDMKAKGPSIPRGELHRLIAETRSLQAILGVYKFFSGRMHLLKMMFERDGLQMPQNLNFELIAKEFIGLVIDRYPSAARVLQTAPSLEISDSLQAQISVYSQWRDGVKGVAPQIFRSLQHRDDVFDSLIDALDQLEDELDNLMIEDENKQEDNE